MNPTVRWRPNADAPSGRGVFVAESLDLDLHEHAGRYDQAVERVDRARGGLEDVDHPLVGAHLELLARLLVNVRAPQDGVALDAGGHGDGAADPRVGALGVVDDFLRRRVQRPVVVRFHPDSNPVTRHNRLLFRPAVADTPEIRSPALT